MFHFTHRMPESDVAWDVVGTNKSPLLLCSTSLTVCRKATWLGMWWGPTSLLFYYVPLHSPYAGKPRGLGYGGINQSPQKHDPLPNYRMPEIDVAWVVVGLNHPLQMIMSLTSDHRMPESDVALCVVGLTQPVSSIIMFHFNHSMPEVSNLSK